MQPINGLIEGHCRCAKFCSVLGDKHLAFGIGRFQGKIGVVSGHIADYSLPYFIP